MESRIAEFLAGELAKRSEVEEHLLVCADCRARFSTAKAGWDAAGEWKAPEPSADAVQSVLANLPAAAPRRRLLRVFQAGTLAASLFISALVGSSKQTGVSNAAPTRPAVAARPASIGLASMRPSVGALYVQDENGRPAGELTIGSLDVRVEIQDGVARTEIEEIFQNASGRRLEGTFIFPLPPDASISRLAMEIDGKLMEGEVVERQKARETYEGIVRRMNDPALLEWMPGGLFKCRIFPIEARSDKRIIIAYTQALSAFDGRATYVYPLAGDSAAEVGIGRFTLEATVRAGSRPLRAESTSHEATSDRVDDRTIRTRYAATSFRPKADFVLAYEAEAASELQLSAHRPDPAAPGYFAAFITPRPDADEGFRRNRRLFFLIDASGSVTRPELEAARTVVRRMIDALGPADRFRIGSHNDLVDSMEEFVAPDAAGKAAAQKFLGAIDPIGAGDPATSLERVLPLVPDDGEVVYVGEGTPTWGEKDPAKIVARLRKVAKDHGVSIRTIAVGSGADRGLLETLAREFNGGSHAISPSDDVRSRADEIARTLGRSAVNGLKVEFQGPVTDAAPARLGSLHFGERLLVTGRYGAGPVKVVLTGKVFDRTIRREFTLTLPERESGNAHVKRLWAQRRLADLVAEGEAKKAEAIKLSVEQQVMTPYTSFLVLESEKAYEDFRIERTKKDLDQTKDAKTAHSQRLNQRRELELLFSQARVHFELLRYDKCIEICNRILQIDPRLTAVEEMKTVAGRLIHAKADPEITRRYLDQWKRSFDKVELMGVVQPDDLGTTTQTETGGIDFTVREPARAGAGFSLEEPDDFGTMGRLLNERTDSDFITFPELQSSNFPDPGDEVNSGPLGLRLYDAQKVSDYRFLRSNRLPLMRGPGPSDLRMDGYYAEGRWGDNQTSPILGDIPNFGFLFGKSRSFSEQGDVDHLSAGLEEFTGQLEAQRKVMRELPESSPDLATAEGKYQELARERQRLQETIASLNSIGNRCDSIAPRRALSGKVMAVVDELDLVAINLGRDAGVNEGDDFTIYHGSTFAGRIVIDSVDRPWASGRIVLRGQERPRIGDDVSNGITLPPQVVSETAISASGSEVQLASADMALGRVLVMIRKGAFVAVVRVYEADGKIAKARVVPGMQFGAVEKGDQGFGVRSWTELWFYLPQELRRDLASRQAVSDARQKLRVLRALKGVTP